MNLVTGPGNIYVVAAKRLLKGRVNIDSEAGPTEIAVLADAAADPVHVAADLISQAEHDPLAAAVLVTDSEPAGRARAGRAGRAGAGRQARRTDREALSGPQSAVVLVDDRGAGHRVVNAYAAEHLEIQTADAERVAGRIDNAGAIFVGPWSRCPSATTAPAAPTCCPPAGCACHSSGLNVKSFLKAVNVIRYSRAALAEVARPSRCSPKPRTSRRTGPR